MTLISICRNWARPRRNSRWNKRIESAIAARRWRGWYAGVGLAVAIAAVVGESEYELGRFREAVAAYDETLLRRELLPEAEKALGIKITFDSGLLFGVDQSTLSPTAQGNLNDLAATLLRVMGSGLKVEYGPERKVNPVSRRLAHASRAKARLGFRAAVSLEEGLRRFVAWFRGYYRL